MCNNLRYQWVGSLLAFLAILLMAIPCMLSRYGEALRKRSIRVREYMNDDQYDEKVAVENDVDPSSRARK
jgi:hypothetical protein